MQNVRHADRHPGQAARSNRQVSARRGVGLTTRLARLGAALLVHAALLQPDTGRAAVYECRPGQFSQQPCPQGRVLDLPGSSAPSDDQVKQAQSVAQREAKLADTLRKDREKRERGGRRPGATDLGPLAAPKSAASARQAEPGKRERDKKPHHKGRTAHRGGSAAPGPGFKAVSPQAAQPAAGGTASAPHASIGRT